MTVKLDTNNNYNNKVRLSYSFINFNGLNKTSTINNS